MVTVEANVVSAWIPVLAAVVYSVTSIEDGIAVLEDVVALVAFSVAVDNRVKLDTTDGSMTGIVTFFMSGSVIKIH